MFSVVLLCVLLTLFVVIQGMCPSARIVECPDKPTFFCCAPDGSTNCTCADSGWKEGNVYDKNGCPADQWVYCIEGPYTCCCGSSFHGPSAECDIPSDTCACL